jgi:AraC-like DNA-binding protein
MVTVSAAYVRIILGGAKRLGIDLCDVEPPELCEKIKDPDGRIDREVANRIWVELARRSGDADIGLHLAEQIEPGAFAVMDYAARSAADLRQAILRFVRYCRLIHDGARVYLTEEGPEARLGFTLAGGTTPLREGAEFMVASWLSSARQMTQQHVIPRSVRFQHPRPERCAEHTRFFGCEVLFGEETSEVVLDSALLTLPVKSADATLGILIDRYAEEMLGRLPAAGDIVERVRKVITEVLRDGEPSIESLAPRLGLSVRSLQRRLREAGTTYKQVLDQVRHDLALRYLGAGEMSIGEVAYLLGFSEASAFHRAFKRWTGSTPGEFRRQSA